MGILELWRKKNAKRQLKSSIRIGMAQDISVLIQRDVMHLAQAYFSIDIQLEIGKIVDAKCANIQVRSTLFLTLYLTR